MDIPNRNCKTLRFVQEVNERSLWVFKVLIGSFCNRVAISHEKFMALKNK